MTTVGLLWSRHGALRFIDSYDGIDAPIDEVLRRQMTRSDRGFSVSPILVNAHDVVSDISGVQRRAKYNRRWNYGFIKQLRLWRNKSIAIAHLIALRMSRKP